MTKMGIGGTYGIEDARQALFEVKRAVVISSVSPLTRRITAISSICAGP